jgi:hypothetical protein
MIEKAIGLGYARAASGHAAAAPPRSAAVLTI